MVKKNFKRVLSILLCMMMLLSMVPMSVFAEDGATTPKPTTDGAYNNENTWASGGEGAITYYLDKDGNQVSAETEGATPITLSKTAAPTGNKNEYQITLQVETSTSTSLKTNAGAVVLVIDRSNSMKYCAECGGNGRHDSDCKYYSRYNNEVTTAQNRMTAAKGAAAEFLASYAGTNPAADRRLCIVTFGTDADVEMSWHNVAGGSGKNDYDTAAAEISGINIRSNTQLGGTNLELGLYTALNQLSEVSNYGSRSVITLTDGIPTYRMNGGNGSQGSYQNNSAAKNRADAIKSTGANLYTVCFGVADDVTYSGGPTVGNFLRDSIASSGCAYNADNSAELYAAFRAITESITSGLSGEGWTATDPMGDHFSVTSGAGDHFVEGSDNTYTWKLENATTETENGVTKYVYTYTYTVKFDTAFKGFNVNQYYPTNKPTYLTIAEGKTLAFPVPGAKGEMTLISVAVSKEWSDADNQDGKRPTSVTVKLLDDGEDTGKTVTLNADNNWESSFTGLPFNNEDGSVINYTVEEVAVTGYTATITGSKADVM